MEFLIYKDNEQHGPYEEQHLLQMLQEKLNCLRGREELMNGEAVQSAKAA